MGSIDGEEEENEEEEQLEMRKKAKERGRTGEGNDREEGDLKDYKEGISRSLKDEARPKGPKDPNAVDLIRFAMTNASNEIARIDPIDLMSFTDASSSSEMGETDVAIEGTECEGDYPENGLSLSFSPTGSL